MDGLAKIISREEVGRQDNLAEAANDQMTCFWLEAPTNELAAYIAKKGSVTLDGVSLTVNAIEGKKTFRFYSFHIR